VPCVEDISSSGGAIGHSGINWNARCEGDVTISKGDLCTILAVDGNVMIVRAVD